MSKTALSAALAQAIAMTAGETAETPAIPEPEVKQEAITPVDPAKVPEPAQSEAKADALADFLKAELATIRTELATAKTTEATLKAQVAAFEARSPDQLEAIVRDCITQLSVPTNAYVPNLEKLQGEALTTTWKMVHEKYVKTFIPGQKTSSVTPEQPVPPAATKPLARPTSATKLTK